MSCPAIAQCNLFARQALSTIRSLIPHIPNVWCFFRTTLIRNCAPVPPTLACLWKSTASIYPSGKHPHIRSLFPGPFRDAVGRCMKFFCRGHTNSQSIPLQHYPQEELSCLGSTSQYWELICPFNKHANKPHQHCKQEKIIRQG